jgi:hypothetical protein
MGRRPSRDVNGALSRGWVDWWMGGGYEVSERDCGSNC